MIPYYERHGGKQHMHNKPIRFGYKAWCLCTRLGYVVQSQLYQGCKTGINDINLGLGGSVVLDLIDKLPEKEGCSLYFDNFFTSITLLETLKEMGLHGTGTMRANRVEKAPLTDVKAMTKKERGTCESITDSNVVTMGSTKGGISPMSKVKRYSQALKKHVLVNQPASIVLYNTYMGGVDRMDENVAKMRVNIRGKKWYWQLLSFLLNVSMNNAWQLYRWNVKTKPQQLDLLNFTRTICLSYLQKYAQRPSIGRPRRLVAAVEKRVTEHVRFDEVNHIITKNEKQTRCALCKKIQE
ncbi:piggyBac transposable element-derived protein 3-like [Nilaparvata lugens]|uniref:piggyBac transposable element-derived protein 3-like n=1 Tax=Nilaparvata lugens TaxID=108931 RepID=UPI00193E4D4B|nr:piggyBac transposable element-derived protein 3-like [Nilaparvata lugens]